MKNIVVVGSSRGIGRGLITILGASNRVLALSRNVEPLLELANANVSIGQFDISSDDALKKFNEIVSKTFKNVDVLINNAGLLINKPFQEISNLDILESYKTNVFGLMNTCQAIIPFMINSGGHIVNIGSMGGFQGSAKFPGLSVYSSSKAAVASFTECLAEELKETKIKVNCLALGATQTEMLEEAFPGYEAPFSANKMAHFIADFGLKSSEWINGKVIPVSMSTP